MEFKEVYKKGLKTGKTITNGSYGLKDSIDGLEFVKTTEIGGIPTVMKIFLDTFEDNWEIIREE